MDQRQREALPHNIQRLIDMVIERAVRDFLDDIAIIGLTGSFATGDYHEKSDVDLIIINDTPRGWEISRCFILGDVGHDIYCTPWETRIEAESNLDSPLISCLVELQILYCSKPEHMERFDAYKNKALAELSKPIGKPCLDRAKKHLDLAKQEYANAILATQIGAVRYAAGGVLYHTLNAVVHMNNTYIKRGTRRYLEELRAYAYLPKDYEQRYMAVIDGKSVDELRKSALALLICVDALYGEMHNSLIVKATPSYDNLKGTYEELWSNCRNKISLRSKEQDKNAAFHAALSAQDFLDAMTRLFGTPRFDVMRHFESDHLEAFEEAFMNIMDEYLTEYHKVGRRVERYDSFEQLYAAFMEQPRST